MFLYIYIYLCISYRTFIYEHAQTLWRLTCWIVLMFAGRAGGVYIADYVYIYIYLYVCIYIYIYIYIYMCMI
jgi:hypothetical protein